MRLILRIIMIPVGLFALYIAIVAYQQITYILGVTQGEPINLKDRPNSALLVIDIQQSLPMTMPGVEAFLDHANQAIDHYGELNSEIIFVTQIKESNSIRSVFLPHIAPRDSAAAALNTNLRAKDPTTFTKLRADTFSNPEFEQYLNEKKIGKLFITGMAAEVCVDYTIQGALNRGYKVYVIQDAVLALFGESSKQKRLKKYADLGAKIISFEEFRNL